MAFFLAVNTADMWEFKLRTSCQCASESESECRASGKREDGEKTGRMEKDSKELKRKHEMVKFRIPAKFVVKCHTPEGDCAGVLCCGPNRPRETVLVWWSCRLCHCDDPEALIDHVASDQAISDIEEEVEVGV